jgi:glycine cleavage system regulatory protein
VSPTVPSTPGPAAPTGGPDSAPRSTAYPVISAADRSRIVEQLADVVAARHPNLTDAQRQELTATLETQVAITETLHAYPLTNADEPVFVVRPGFGR